MPNDAASVRSFPWMFWEVDKSDKPFADRRTTDSRLLQVCIRVNINTMIVRSSWKSGATLIHFRHLRGLIVKTLRIQSGVASAVVLALIVAIALTDAERTDLQAQVPPTEAATSTPETDPETGLPYCSDEPWPEGVPTPAPTLADILTPTPGCVDRPLPGTGQAAPSHGPATSSSLSLPSLPGNPNNPVCAPWLGIYNTPGCGGLSTSTATSTLDTSASSTTTPPRGQAAPPSGPKFAWAIHYMDCPDCPKNATSGVTNIIVNLSARQPALAYRSGTPRSWDDYHYYNRLQLLHPGRTITCPDGTPTGEFISVGYAKGKFVSNT